MDVNGVYKPTNITGRIECSNPCEMLLMLLETVCSTSLRCRLCSTKGRMHSTALSVQTKCGCKYAKCMTLWCEVVGTKLVVAEGTFFLGKRILSQKYGQKQDQQLPRSSKIFQAFNVMHVVHQHLKISRSQDPNSTRLYSRGFFIALHVEAALSTHHVRLINVENLTTGNPALTCQKPWEKRWNKFRWYPQQLQRFIFTHAAKPNAGKTSACSKASRNLLRNLLWNLLQNPVEPDLALYQSLPDLLRNLRNLLWNLVEPDPAPAPVHTGAILGWRPH